MVGLIDAHPRLTLLADKGEGLREIKLVDFGLHKIIHLHSEESIRGAGRSGRGPGGSVRGPGGSVRGGSQNNSGHSSGKSGLNASMEAMLHLSTASRKNKSAHDAVWQEMLKAGADMHTGTNGSVHARNTFSGLQDIGYEMTGGCGSLMCVFSGFPAHAPTCPCPNSSNAPPPSPPLPPPPPGQWPTQVYTIALQYTLLHKST